MTLKKLVDTIQQKVLSAQNPDYGTGPSPYGQADPNNLTQNQLLGMAQQGLSAGQKVGGVGANVAPGIGITPLAPPQPAAPAPAPAPTAPAAPPQDDLSALLASLSAGNSGSTIDLSGALAALQGGQAAPLTSILPDLQSLLGAAPSLPTTDINKQAQNQIDLKYGGQENAIKQALQQIASQTQIQQGQQQQYGQQADQSLQSIFSALQSDLGAGAKQSQQNYADTRSAVGGSYDTAQQGLGDLNSSILSKISQSLGGLGLGQAMPQPLSQIEQGYQQQQGANINNKATALAGIDSSSANQAANMQNFQNSANRQGATTRADLATSVQQALANIGLAGSQAQNSQIGQLSTLEQQKPLDLQNLIAQLTQTQYQQQEQAQKDRLGEITGLGGLDIQNQQNQIAQQGQQTDLQTALAKLLGDQATSQATINAQYNNPLTVAKTASEIQNNQANAAYKGAQTTNLANPQAPPTQSTVFPSSLDSFLHSPQSGLWGAGGAGPRFSGDLQGLIQQAQKQSSPNGAPLPASQEYAWALQQLPNIPDFAQLNPEGLRTALRLFFTGK